MRIVGATGPVSHAWLDAGLLHETCDGFQCRITVGAAGWLVCDLIHGNRHLAPIAVSRLAYAAVRNVHPGDANALPVVDDDGQAVLIIGPMQHGNPETAGGSGSPTRKFATIAALFITGMTGITAMAVTDDASVIHWVGVVMMIMAGVGLYVIGNTAISRRETPPDSIKTQQEWDEEMRFCAPTSVTVIG